jgi:hypothetical protein
MGAGFPDSVFDMTERHWAAWGNEVETAFGAPVRDENRPNFAETNVCEKTGARSKFMCFRQFVFRGRPTPAVRLVYRDKIRRLPVNKALCPRAPLPRADGPRPLFGAKELRLSNGAAALSLHTRATGYRRSTHVGYPPFAVSSLRLQLKKGR